MLDAYIQGIEMQAQEAENGLEAIKGGIRFHFHSIIHHAAEGVSVRATARLLGLDKNLVNRVILRAGEHCAAVLSTLLQSLHLSEVQLDELWAFVKKNKVIQKRMKTTTAKNGYGRPQMPPHGS